MIFSRGYLNVYGLFSVGFNVNWVVFRKIFILSAGVMFGIILGVKRYADYEYLVAVAFLNV